LEKASHCLIKGKPAQPESAASKRCLGRGRKTAGKVSPHTAQELVFREASVYLLVRKCFSTEYFRANVGEKTKVWQWSHTTYQQSEVQKHTMLLLIDTRQKLFRNTKEKYSCKIKLSQLLPNQNRHPDFHPHKLHVTMGIPKSNIIHSTYSIQYRTKNKNKKRAVS
jgi:hypothetical protein